MNFEAILRRAVSNLSLPIFYVVIQRFAVKILDFQKKEKVVKMLKED